MPLDVPASLGIATALRPDTLIDPRLPRPVIDTLPEVPVVDAIARVLDLVGDVQIDDNLQGRIRTLPLFRTPLEVATFFINAKYDQLGGAAGFLGSTATAVSACPDRVGFYRHFQNGSIYWLPSTGAHEVHGEIRDKWAALGWERSFLGYPVSDETVGADANGDGRFSRFQGGAIYWYPHSGPQVAVAADVARPAMMAARLPGIVMQPGPSVGGIVPLPPIPIVPSNAHEVHGAIAAKYRMLGAEASVLGYPTTDETGTPDGIGRFNHFQAGSIYWTPNTGAWEVHGLIREYWAAHGWERNPDLGYPISDELIPDRRIGHARPDPIRKPIASLPVDRIKLPAEAAALGFPRAVVNVPVAGNDTLAATLRPDLIATVGTVVSGTLGGIITATESETPFPGGSMSDPAPEGSRNRFGDFENGVLFWRRGDAAAQPLAPWTATADGTNLRLTAADVIRIVQPRVMQALGALGDLTLTGVTFLGTTGYSFDGVGVHNRRHRLQFAFQGTRMVGFFPMPVHAFLEVQVEAAYEPIQRIVSGQIVDWHFLGMTGDVSLLVRQARAGLDAALWTGFTLLQLPATNAGAPLAVLSVKTMVNGDVNLYIES